MQREGFIHDEVISTGQFFISNYQMCKTQAYAAYLYTSHCLKRLMSFIPSLSHTEVM